jgi:pimeloyl-ACP methyl ester carboxylesterase
MLHYELHKQSNQSEWMILVHGAGGSARTWRRQLDDFGAEYNLLLIDLPGHGLSRDRTVDIDQYSFEFVAKKIWDVADALEIKKAHLVGISLGTILCLQMRLMHPNRVCSMILPGAIVQLNTKLKVLARTSLALAQIIGYSRFYKLSARIMLPRKNHKQSRDVFIKESRVLTVTEFKKWTQMYYHLNGTLREIFKSTSEIPHLLVMGSQDHLFLPAARSFTSSHKNAHLQVIQNCGHVVSIEKAQKFNQICLNFLKRLREQTAELVIHSN